MEKSKSSHIEILQALHGYRDGHKLLAGSISLDEYSGIEMARMSDLMPQKLIGTSAYLCGYPLKSINKYVIAKTWAAPEMSRPGCVWTHSLLLDYSSVAKLVNLEGLFHFFSRPVFGDYDSYAKEVRLMVREADSALSRGHSSFLEDDILEREQLRRALISIYFNKVNKILLPSLRNISLDDATAVLIWNQMPPRLRRDFVFCTAGSPRSLTPPAEVTLIISDECDSSSHEVIDDEAAKTLEVLLDDVVAPVRTELRSFINRYVTDARDARTSVVKLANVAALLFIHNTERGLGDAAHAVVSSFPLDGDCGLLKREFLLGALLDVRRYKQAERTRLVLRNVLPEMKFLQPYGDSEAIDSFVQQVIDASEISALISGCHGVSRSSLGYELLRALCLNLSVTELASIPLHADSKLMLASFKSELLERQEFWRTFESEPTSSDWEALNLIGNLELLAAGFLTGQMYGPVRKLLNENPELFTPAIVRFLQCKSDTEHEEVLREFRSSRLMFVQYLATCGDSGIEIMKFLAKDIFYSPYPEVASHFWVSLFQKNRAAVENISPYVAFVLFEQAGRAASRPEAIFLYQLSFEVLHSLELTNGLDARIVAEKILSTYSSDYVGGESNAGSRVRKKLCSFFEGSRQYHEFFLCVRSDQTLGLLFQSMSRLWSGKEWLKGLLTEIEQGRVHVTNSQKQLLINVLPQKKKGLFDMW